MDTVWTTVKVRRSTLAEAAEKLPGMSNAKIVQRALEGITTHLNRQAHEAPAQPGDVGFSPRQDEIDLYAGTGSEFLKRQITVDEALGRCPVCNDSLDDERRCVDPECSSHRVTS